MKKALVIGIDDYPSSPLFGCVNDAVEFRSVLETNGDGSPNFEVKLEKNVQTRGQLLGLIKELFSGDDAEISLMYFSGHGYSNDLGGYLVTPDAMENEEGVSMDELLTIANNSAIKNKIIILDCCNSGAMGTPAINNGLVTQISTGVTVLTASRDKQPSLEVNGHGLFTALLLDALRGGAADILGQITPGSVYAYIDQALGVWSQRPMFKTNISQFTPIRSITPQVPASILREITKHFPSPTDEYQLESKHEFTSEDADPEKVSVFKTLQKYEGVGLVVPVGEEHMYWAAMNNKTCRLTALGYHYWRLVNDKRI